MMGANSSCFKGKTGTYPAGWNQSEALRFTALRCLKTAELRSAPGTSVFKPMRDSSSPAAPRNDRPSEFFRSLLSAELQPHP
jgi:hypothetical protein